MSVRTHSARFLAALAGGASLFALGYSQPVLAQADQPAASNGGTLEEVVVTARRKEEKAQTVPISLTTFNQSALTSQDIRSSTDLQKVVPGFTATNANPTSQHIWVRGITGAVAYFNDAPEISPTGRDLFFDVGSVQLLKGPQGTLFGIATNGGALVVEPKKPTNNFEGYTEVTLGNYGRNTETGVVNIPVIEDKFLVRAGIQHSHTDGYVHEISRGIDLQDENYNIGRVTAIFRPTDDIQNEFLAGYYNSSSNAAVIFVPLRINSTQPSLSAVLRLPYYSAVLAAFNTQQKLGLYTVAGDDVNGAVYGKANQTNLINTTTWDVNDNLTVKNILSYVEINTASISPGLGLVVPGHDIQSGRTSLLSNGYVPFPYTPTGPTIQYAEELQLQGRALDDKLSFTLGTFNSRTGVRGPTPIDCTTSFDALSCSGNRSDNGTTNAVYGQGTYDLGVLIDGLSFTGGYRYTWDRIYTEQNSYSIVNGTGVRVASASGSVVGYFKAPTYTMSLDYQLDPSTLLYVTNSKGYSKGGFNSFTVPSQFRSFQPETLNETEIGIKTDQEIMGVKTRANVAAYYGAYDRIQATQSFTVVVGGVTSTPQATGNAASGFSEGVDGEFTIIPDPSLELYANVGYNVTAYDSYPSIDPATGATIDLSSQRPLVAPLWKFTVRATYHVPLGWISNGEDLGDLTITPSYFWNSVTNHAQGLNLTLASLELFPDFGSADITVNWRNMLGRSGLDGTFFLTNLFNNQWTQATNAGYNNVGMTAMSPAAPRMMGVTLRYSFGP